jgi:hypothetical protein
MASLRYVAHAGVLCTFSNRSAPDRGMWFVRAGGMDRPSRTKSHPARSLSSRQPGGLIGLATYPAISENKRQKTRHNYHH